MRCTYNVSIRLFTQNNFLSYKMFLFVCVSNDFVLAFMFKKMNGEFNTRYSNTTANPIKSPILDWRKSVKE